MSEIHYIEENLPHKVSEVVCLICLNRWVAVRPLCTKLKDLQCPKCRQQGYVIETGEIIDTEDYA